MQNSTDHAIQNHVCWQGGIFTSGVLRVVIVTHRLTNEKEIAGRLGSPGCQLCFFDVKFHKFDYFQRQLASKKLFVFSQYLAFLKAVGTCYQTGVFSF